MGIVPGAAEGVTLSTSSFRDAASPRATVAIGGNDSVFSRTLQSPHAVAEKQLIYCFIVELFHFAFTPQQTVLDLRSPGWGVFYDS
ncbi:hypothetical protein [Bradyrhizobium japonicum]|uniref:hypothetical protein n=1 Tax=Bradyrhizobium japonicum TaxID=375 RepID=UPI0027154C48|nr:hypothetical protein [Bradyrhizobium japonicum]WLB52149.1 hypothetical protein QIH94_33005 [Bradyrhizobium japonicum]WLB66079.1 hypothetical protein QIH96_13310 [Bradyrhizobium japonicum]